MQRSLADENYLKAVFHLSGDQDVPVATGLLADYLNVSAASVTDKMKRLQQKGWVNYQKSRGTVLSSDGKKIALSVIRKHRLWEQFLVQVLDFKWDEVHDIAEQLEHIQSDELIGRIDHYLGYPTADPHGDPIPDEEGEMNDAGLLLLSDAPAGKKFRVAAVANHDAEFLRFLEKKGLMLHSEVILNSREDYDGTVSLTRESRPAITLSKQVVRQIWVKEI